jgi:hypothetical protein
MDYRGIPFSIIPISASGWAWRVRLDGKVSMGNARNRQVAVLGAMNAINKLLRKRKRSMSGFQRLEVIGRRWTL